MQRLADHPVATRFLRIWMTESSNTCDTHGSDDPRNCVGYAISEISAGNFNSLGEFVDLVKHTPSQAQTVTQVSSVDPWHTEEDIVSSRIQTGFDLFFTSGYTNHLPAMIPIAMIYATPEDSAAELAYIEKRGYPVSYVEMSEEPDGAYMLPEDYAAFYLQWAKALHKVDPKLKLGGPVFTGENEDIKVWPDARGTDFVAGPIPRLSEGARADGGSGVCFVRALPAGSVRDQLVGSVSRAATWWKATLEAWRDDGVPADVPLMNTESNRVVGADRSDAGFVRGIVAGRQRGGVPDRRGTGRGVLPFADSAGAAAAGMPGLEHVRKFCGGRKAGDQATYGAVFRQPAAESGLGETRRRECISCIRRQWDLQDEANHELITAYAVKRPDGEWSLLHR